MSTLKKKKAKYNLMSLFIFFFMFIVLPTISIIARPDEFVPYAILVIVIALIYIEGLSHRND